MILITILVLILFIELKLSPRIDITIDNKIILWYGIINRKYIILYKPN